MSTFSAMRANSNGPVAWCVQRMRKGAREDICVITSGCNDGVHGRNGVLAKMRAARMTSALRKYRKAAALGQARVVTWEA